MSVLIVNPPASLAIGSAIGSGTANSVLYIDGSGNLAQLNPGLTYDGTEVTIGPGGSSGSGFKSLLKFNNSTAEIPKVRWRQTSGNDGLGFYSIQNNLTELLVAKFQDNGALVVTFFESTGNFKFRDYFIQRGGSQAIYFKDSGESAFEFSGGSANWNEYIRIINSRAAGFGLALEGATSQSEVLMQLRGVTSTSTRAQVDIDTAWATSTDATRKARGIFRVWDTSAREGLRIESDGANALLSVGGTSVSAFFTHKASATSNASVNVPAGTAPTSPIEGDLWNDSTQKSRMVYQDAIKQSLQGVIFTQTADKSVTNTTTETSIVGTGVGGLTLPANFFVAGKTVRITMSGVYSTVAVTGDTVTIKVKYGSTVLASKATSSLLTGASNLAWFSEVLITCRTTGATGTVQVSGGVIYQVAGSTTVEDELNNGVATTTLDTTASSLIDVTVTHSAANAANTVKSLVGSFEVLN